MDITIYPKKLCGRVTAPRSKSQAHRLLICAAFADRPTTLICPETNDDIEATVACLRALGSDIQRTPSGYQIFSITAPRKQAVFSCRESGSTLRFLLPVVGALGIDATFVLEGRLADRPLSPLWKEMERHGCKLEWINKGLLRCSGELRSGSYRMAGDVSSQFISGLMMAFPLLEGSCTLDITEPMQSRPYIELTRGVLSLFGIGPNNSGCYRSPGTVTVEGDWSSAAFFLGANALGSNIQVDGLDPDSVQGDSVICPLLAALKTHCEIDVSDIPDLFPILAVVAAWNQGAVFTNIQRLRLKESDRIAAMSAALKNLGIATKITDSTFTVLPGTLTGGEVDSYGDHRIAMAAAIAATAAFGPITVRDARCVKKSYPRFWEDYQALGGQYGFDLR